MSSTSETGHAKNVANFKSLIDFCAGYGPAYNPPKTTLKLPALNAMHEAAEAAIAATTTQKNSFDTATGARQAAYEDLRPLSTRIINLLPATDASPQTIDDAKSLNRLIQGRRATPPAKDTTADGKPSEDHHISVSRQSYDMLADNFAALVDLVASIPTYTPHEDELKAETLTERIASLKAANQTVSQKEVALSNARIARDKILYTEKTGLVDTALDVKKYIKAAFGATSPQYAQVEGILFRKF